MATFEHVYEPILDLDILSLPNRADWSRNNMFAPQPYLQFGVNTDNQLQALRGVLHWIIYMLSVRYWGDTIRCNKAVAQGVS